MLKLNERMDMMSTIVTGKREREDACSICKHYHDYYGGEMCSICGHVRLYKSDRHNNHFNSSNSTTNNDDQHFQQRNHITSNLSQLKLLITNFLYIGNCEVACHKHKLYVSGITHLLSCIPKIEMLSNRNFTCHYVTRNPPPFDECFQFLDMCYKNSYKVLIYCTTGMSRSPTIAIGYLMKLKKWNLCQSYTWAKNRHKDIKLTQKSFKRLYDLELELFGNHSVNALNELNDIITSQTFTLPNMDNSDIVLVS